MRHLERAQVGAENFVASQYAAVRGYARIGVIADPTSLLPATAEHLVDRMHVDRHLVNISWSMLQYPGELFAKTLNFQKDFVKIYLGPTENKNYTSIFYLQSFTIEELTTI